MKDMTSDKPKAHLHVVNIETREIVHSIPLMRISDRYVERVMMGMFMNMNTDKYFIDDSEVDAARELER